MFSLTLSLCNLCEYARMLYAIEKKTKNTNESGEVSVAQAPLYLKAIWSSLFVFVSISFKSVVIEAIDYIY